MLVGAPIEVEKKLNPSTEDIDELHEKFCKALNELFETHKAKYVEKSENLKLAIE